MDSMLQFAPGIDGDRLFEKIGRKKPISIFRAIFDKGGDLDYHDLDSRFSRISADFYTILSAINGNIVNTNIFRYFSKQFRTIIE